MLLSILEMLYLEGTEMQMKQGNIWEGWKCKWKDDIFSRVGNGFIGELRVYTE
jgi:hypothetical protein